MHIYIIAQYLNFHGEERDRLFALGRKWLQRGDQVTVFTNAGRTGFDLGDKKVGFSEQEGLPVISLNVPYDRGMGFLKKIYSFWRFADLVNRQGRLVPPPDLILALSPPLTALWPAMKLAGSHGVPLVADIRELWPDGPVKRGSLRGRCLIGAVQKLEKKVYSAAKGIICASDDAAEEIRARGAEKKAVTVARANLGEEEYFSIYDEIIKGI